MASKVSITKSFMSSLEAGPKDRFFWDDEVSGFGVKVTPAGNKSYVLSFWLDGKKDRFKIGDHGPWTPQTARDEAKRLRRLIDQGIHPRREEMQRRTDRQTLEVGEYVERFIEQYLKHHWRGGFDLASGTLRRNVVPAWKGRHLKEIRRSDVADLMDGLTGIAQRRNCFAVVRKMFRWAVNKGDIEDSPIRDMDAPSAPRSRDRVLSDEELALCWETAVELDYPFGPFFRLLILTGQRRSEVAGIQWQELDRSLAVWTIPAERAKNSVVSDVPLSEAALAILDGVAALRAGTKNGEDVKWPRKGFVFSTTGKTAISGYSKAKARLDRLMLKRAKELAEACGDNPEQVDVKPWHPHDLRRTLATGLQRAGVVREVTEAVLNHRSGSLSGIAGVYQRHDYKDEKRAALQDWGEHVLRIVAKRQKDAHDGNNDGRIILLHAA